MRSVNGRSGYGAPKGCIFSIQLRNDYTQDIGSCLPFCEILPFRFYSSTKWTAWGIIQLRAYPWFLPYLCIHLHRCQSAPEICPKPDGAFIKVTMDLYRHLVKETLDGARRKIEDAGSNTKPTRRCHSTDRNLWIYLVSRARFELATFGLWERSGQFF